MDKIINLRLMSHPVNWLIVWTVLLFAGTAWHFLTTAGDAPGMENPNADNR